MLSGKTKPPNGVNGPTLGMTGRPAAIDALGRAINGLEALELQTCPTPSVGFVPLALDVPDGHINSPTAKGLKKPIPAESR